MPLLGLENPNPNNLFERQVRRNLEEMFRSAGYLNPAEEARVARERQLQSQGPTIAADQNPFLVWLSRLGNTVQKGVESFRDSIVEGISSRGIVPKPAAEIITDIFLPQSPLDVLGLATVGPIGKVPTIAKRAVKWELGDMEKLGAQLMDYINQKASVLKAAPWTPSSVENVVGDTIIDALEYIQKKGPVTSPEKFTDIVDDLFKSNVSKHTKEARKDFSTIVGTPSEKPIPGEIRTPIEVGRGSAVEKPLQLRGEGTYRSEEAVEKLKELIKDIDDPWAFIVARESTKIPKGEFRHTVPTKKGSIVAVKTPGTRELSRRLDIPPSSVARYVEKAEEALTSLGKGEKPSTDIFDILKSTRSFINKRTTPEERAKIFESIAAEMKGSVRGTALSQAKRYLAGERPSKIQNFDPEAVIEILNTYLKPILRRRRNPNQ